MDDLQLSRLRQLGHQGRNAVMVALGRSVARVAEIADAAANESKGDEAKTLPAADIAS